jgi:YggT family protein
MDIFVVPVLLLLKSIINLAMMVVIADVIIGWLITANILNAGNQFIYAVVNSLSKMSNFMLRPIRERMPDVGPLDISPVVLVLLMTFCEHVINRILMKLA